MLRIQVVCPRRHFATWLRLGVLLAGVSIGAATGCAQTGPCGDGLSFLVPSDCAHYVRFHNDTRGPLDVYTYAKEDPPPLTVGPGEEGQVVILLSGTSRFLLVSPSEGQRQVISVPDQELARSNWIITVTNETMAGTR